MLATLSGTQTAMIACQGRSERMPFPMSAKGMCMFAAASIIIIETGVLTSVSLFVVVLLAVSLLLVSIVVLISLILIGLTGLVGLESLVGLVTTVAARTTRGD